MEETWRWFGPADPVPLTHVRQAGATGVVTALHHVPVGRVWPLDEIQTRKTEVEAAGLTWSVVESLPVSEAIKTQTGLWRTHLDAYRVSLENLSRSGVTTVCYNFMPVLDWTRTDLSFAMPDGSLALRFDADAFAAFDLFILQRAEAERDWSPEQIERARDWFNRASTWERERLTRTIIAGLPGAEASYTLGMFRDALRAYDELSETGMRSHLIDFVRAVAPIAAECSVRLCIHPDDPPFSLLGLPRVISKAADVRLLLHAFNERANGLTFCTGSFGVRADNDLPAMVREFGERIHFAHLRSTRRDGPVAAGRASFNEANHLDGDVDMVSVLHALLREERRRREAGRIDSTIPMRPDHGHQMLDDLAKQTNPGYSAIGRLRGLAELRGVCRAIERMEGSADC